MSTSKFPDSAQSLLMSSDLARRLTEGVPRVDSFPLPILSALRVIESDLMPNNKIMILDGRGMPVGVINLEDNDSGEA